MADSALIARMCETQFTREHRAGAINPTRNMSNRKPYRTASQKAKARENARQVNGAWVSSAPVTFHKPVK